MIAQWQVREENKKLQNLLAQRVDYWKQRSKIFWLQSRDMNTKLFHAFASSRKRKNSLHSLHLRIKYLPFFLIAQERELRLLLQGGLY